MTPAQQDLCPRPRDEEAYSDSNQEFVPEESSSQLVLTGCTRPRPGDSHVCSLNTRGLNGMLDRWGTHTHLNSHSTRDFRACSLHVPAEGRHPVSDGAQSSSTRVMRYQIQSVMHVCEGRVLKWFLPLVTIKESTSFQDLCYLRGTRWDRQQQFCHVRRAVELRRDGKGKFSFLPHRK